VASPTVDPTFNPPAINGIVTGMSYDSGKNALYIAGDFTTVGTTGRTYFACLNATSGALMSWNVTITNVNVNYHPGRRIMIGKHAKDTGVYIVGAFDTVNGNNLTGIACIANDPTNSSPALQSWRPDVKGTAAGADVGTQGHDLDIKPDGTKLIVAYAGGGTGNDGNHGVAYQLIDANGNLNRQNTRLWTSSVTGDSGDHNACGCDDTYCAFGHHGNGSTTNTDGLGNPKCYIVKWDGTASHWIVNTFSGTKGVYTVEFSADRFLVGGNLTAPRTGLVQFDRTVTGGGGDVTPPTAPTSLSAVVEGSSAIGLNWGNSTDNVGVVSYRIYRNGVLVGTVPGP
jgi:hypothetical protein